MPVKYRIKYSCILSSRFPPKDRHGDQGRLEKPGFDTAWCHSILQAGLCVCVCRE